MMAMLQETGGPVAFTQDGESLYVQARMPSPHSHRHIAAPPCGGLT